MKKILITDTLFIFDEHIKTLESAGYEVVRIEKPDMSEGELKEAIADKTGYILGGIEYVTDSVIEAAKELRAVVFTGTGYKGHIPGYKAAFANGVLIGNTPYANVHEVAEWALAATLAMQRDLFSLGPKGGEKFHTISSLPDLSIGVIGLGHIGKKYADMVSSIGAKEVSYWSRSRKDVDYTYLSREELLEVSDIVFVAVGDDAGDDFIGEKDFSLMKKDALLVSISHHGIVNENELLEAIKTGRIRAALDIVKDIDSFRGLPESRWYGSNASAAYNSTSYLKRSSDMAVNTLLNLLKTGDDDNRVIDE